MIGILEILCSIIVVLLTFYYYYTFNFWKKHGVFGPKALPYFGTIKDTVLGRMTMMQYIKEIYTVYKDKPLVGIYYYSVPLLVINDIELIKDVLVTDAMTFVGRGITTSKKAEPLLDNMFYMNGKESLELRAKLSSIFTPSKLKHMFPLLLQRSEVFKNWLDTLLLKTEQINCSELTKQLTADFSCTCLFGYDIKSIGDEKNEILYGAKIFGELNWKTNIKQLIKSISMQLYNLIGYYLFDNAKVISIFNSFAKDIIMYRTTHDITKYDVANVLFELAQKEDLAGKIETADKFFSAQVCMFFIAAFDTSAVTIANTMYELALNQIIQDKLREEIRSIYTKNEEITFNDINVMPYLDAIIKETSRKYPTADTIQRVALSPYTFKNSQVTIPEGQHVIIPAYALHTDPEIYPNPEIYDPERFFNDKTKSRSICYMPFGHGPRNCIGERFGLLQTKMGLITIFRNYKIDICKKTQIPYAYAAEKYVQQSQGIYLKITKID